MVNPMESSSDQIRQPGMKRTCARLPGCLNMNMAAYVPDCLAVVVALMVVARVAPVRLVAAGLRQAARDHVADRQDRDVEPDLVGTERIDVVLLLDLCPGDQDQGERDEVRVELGRLECGLRLG